MEHLGRARIPTLALLLAACSWLTGCPGGDRGSGRREPAVLFLTILHHHGGRSALAGDDAGTPDDPLDDLGGIARFVTLAGELRMQGSAPRADGRAAAAILLSAGDETLAGAVHDAGERAGVCYDARALGLVGFDAVSPGNREFNLGAGAFAALVSEVVPPVPFLAANLDVSAEPALESLTRSSPPALARSARVVLRSGGRAWEIGVVGAVAPDLARDSRPGAVRVGEVAAAIRAEAGALAAEGVGIVIAVSHFESLSEHLALVRELRGVDVLIAGGVERLLAAEGTPLRPGDSRDPDLPYPLLALDGLGAEVPVVTAPGSFDYIGRLVVGFDRRGVLVEIETGPDPVVPERGPLCGPVRVVGEALAGGVRPDETAAAEIESPVAAHLAELAENIVAVTEEDLDGRAGKPGRGVATAETNLGGLLADALRWRADRSEAETGLAGGVHFALFDAGRIGLGRVIPRGAYDPGPIREIDLFDLLPRPDLLAVVKGLTAEDVKRLLEHAVSGVEEARGRFVQVSGELSFVVDLAGPVPVTDPATGRLLTPGGRVSDVWIGRTAPGVGGTRIVDESGRVLAVPGPFHVAVPDALARRDEKGRGADGCPWGGAEVAVTGITCRRALLEFLTAARSEGGLGGVVGREEYPWEGRGFGKNRIEVLRPEVLRIPDLQGAGHRTPFEGHVARDVTGVVLCVEFFPDAYEDDGFFLQAENGDGDPDTSDGVWVMTGRAEEGRSPEYTAGAEAGRFVFPGDRARVTGRVVEQYPGGYGNGGLGVTTIHKPSIERLATGAPLPEPVTLGRGGRIPPNRIFDDDGLSEYDPNGPGQSAQDAVDFFEALEGMHVRLEAPLLCVTGNAKYGEIAVLLDRGAGIRDDAVFSPFGGVVVREGVRYPDVLIIDDVINFLDPAARTGDRLRAAGGGGTIDGVIHYSFGSYRFLNTTDLAVTAGGAEPERTELASSATAMTVATWNLKNLAPRQSPRRFDNLAAAIVTNLGAPDVVAVQEVQDENGPEPGSPAGAATFAELVHEVNRAPGGPGDYDFVQIDPESNSDGGEPEGNIRAGFLYRRTRLRLAGGTLGAGDAISPTAVVSGPALTLNPGRVDPLHPAWEESRKPLAVHFVAVGDGSDLFFVNVHLKSRSGDDPLFGARQPPRSATRSRREAQAAVVDGFVGEILAADPGAKVVVLGDLNDDPFSGTADILGRRLVRMLTGAGPSPDEDYTYIHDGTCQALDNVFVSPSLAAEATHDVVHLAQDFENAVYRNLSDHDPVVVRLGGFAGLP